MTQDLGTRRSLRGVVVITTSLFCANLFAQTTFEDVFEQIKTLNEASKESLGTVEDLDDENTSLSHQYRQELQNIDGQRVVNRTLDLQIAKQNDEIETLKQSIAEVDLIESRIIPLMARMIEALEQFIKQDKPFLLEERLALVAELREMQTAHNIDDSEKFAQVLQAYEIESEYGRTMEVIQGELELPDGKPYNVNFLRVGRIAWVYQTLDGSRTGWWNPGTKAYEELPASYTNPIRNGIRIANKQLSSNLFVVPVYIEEEN